MKKYVLFLTIHFIVYTFYGMAQPAVGLAQSGTIQSGPMVGYSDYREALLWVQTKKPATVKFTFWEQGQPTQRRSTADVRTEAANAYTARALASDLTPGKRYEYEVYVDGKKVVRTYPLQFQTQSLWQWRTDPPALRFVVGSCTYVNESEYDRPGTPYGSNYQIFNTIASQKPDFMLWTGDNTYTREVDWNSRSGLLHRYTHTRSLPEMQALLGSTHNYATWDDHDYGPNDADRSYWLKRDALQTFKMFWGNPNYVFENEGVTGTFQWADCQFFLMDDRWWRSPNDLKQANREYLGPKQLDWLIDALAGSRASFKFVVIGNQVVNPEALFENYANYAGERADLFRRITESNIPGVLFLSGDRHHSVLWKQDRPGTYPLYDLTISPLTSGAAKMQKTEEALLQFPETYVSEQNFGLMEVTGPLSDRVLKITCINASGTTKWTREINASALRPGK
ncbi:MAG: alkaline phosphatase family protein [Cytophagaceae bacterium]|nr:alkaline phosphatase family protein [Cytophagaceae bacterium]